VWLIEPPAPIRKDLYWCDKKFHVDDLKPLFQKHEWYTLIVIRGEECSIFDVNAVETKCLKRLSPSLPNHHSRGGQSQNRLMRLREQSHDAYVKYVAEWVSEHFPPERKLIVAGNSTKLAELTEILEKPRTVVASFVVQDDQDAVKRCQGFIADKMKWKHEDEWWDKFQAEWNNLLRGIPSKAVYGRDAVLEALHSGELETALIHSQVNSGIDPEASPATEVVILHNPNHPILSQCGGWVGIRFYATSTSDYLGCRSDNNDTEELEVKK